jgi:hypothetical protein
VARAGDNAKTDRFCKKVKMMQGPAAIQMHEQNAGQFLDF